MLNIPLFTIRQYQIRIRCKSKKGTDFYIYYKLVLISIIRVMLFCYLREIRGIVKK
jgi:hypothetical protein